ncbi:hypothetical protein LSH36_832g01015, partial [Paralvinella palmiformis]
FLLIGVSEIFKSNRESRLDLQGYHNLITRCRKYGARRGVELFIREYINLKIREYPFI